MPNDQDHRAGPDLSASQTPRSIRILVAASGPPRGGTPKAPEGDELQEVIVTANRREENLQDVPMTVQVLTGDALAKASA
jgi:hypothetical protein